MAAHRAVVQLMAPSGSGAAAPSGALRAIDPSARPRLWRTFGPRRLRRQSEPALVATQDGAAAVLASSAPASQQVEHDQPHSHQGKEDEHVPDDFHHNSSILASCSVSARGSGHAAREHGSSGRRPPGGGTCSTSSALPGWGLGSSRASAAAASSATRALSCRPATCHTQRSGGMPRQVVSTSQRRCTTAWIGVLSGGNWPHQRRRMRQPRAVGLITMRPPIWPPHYRDRAACNRPFSTLRGPKWGCAGPHVSIL
jgi:hypothetical protein